MRATLVHYIVHPEMVADHISAVKKLFQSLKQDCIPGIDYSIYLLGENIFIHLMRYQSEECIDKLNERDDIRTFLVGMQMRLKEEPIPIYIKSIAILNEISTIKGSIL